MTPSPSLLAHAHQFFIDGKWVDNAGGRTGPVLDPATEESIGSVALGSPHDVDEAVSAARGAFDAYAAWPVAERQALLRCVTENLAARREELAHVLSLEMGAP